MAFHDVQLPVDIERGAHGGPAFNTTVTALQNGSEVRNENWSQTRGNWSIGFGIDTKDQYTRVIKFFYARHGRAHSFRFKDWADYNIGAVASPQQIATGDGSTLTFQLTKVYTDAGGYSFTRNIRKPVSGTLTLYVNGSLTASGWSIDYNTGIITFVSPPALGAVISIICEFDNAVRFDIDALDVNLEMFDAGAVPNINIIEVRNE